MKQSNSLSRSLVFAVNLLLSAPAANALDIAEAWALVQKSNPELQQADIQRQINDLDVQANRRAYWPNASASFGSSWNDQSQEVSSSFGASITQSLWDSNLHYQLAQAKEDAVAAKLDEQKTISRLAMETGNAYLALAKAHDALTLAQQKFSDGNRLLEITNQRYLAGKIQRIEVTEMQSNQLDEQASILSATADIEQRKLDLERLTGQPADQVLTVRDDLADEPAGLPLADEDWLRRAQQHNGDLLSANAQLRSEQIKRQQAKAGYWPTLSSSVSYSREDFSGSGNISASVSLSVPIDLNGKQRLAVAERNFQVLNAQQQVREKRLQLKKDIKVLLSQFRLQWQRIAITHQQLAMRQQTLQLKQTLYNAGLSDATDLIEAHNSVFAISNELKSQLYEYWTLRLNLLYTAGYHAEYLIDDLQQAFVN